YGRTVKYLAQKKKNITPTHIYNYQVMLIRFLNHIAEQLHLPKIDFFLKQPAFSSKWHLDEDDVQRILKYNPTTQAQKDVLDIININKKIGLRIGEILNILLDNITFDADACYIRFLEEKKSKERTVVVVDKEAIDIIKSHMQNNNDKYLWRFHGYNWFNTVLQEQIAKEVFKEETVKIYKNTYAIDGYVSILKWKAISSHAFRRFAIERNIVDYGIDVARSLSGHSDTKIMFKHYADFMNSADLKNKLLGK
ncbi:MAG: site-specific integrase, partial [Bacteroidales bacterium]